MEGEAEVSFSIITMFSSYRLAHRHFELGVGLIRGLCLNEYGMGQKYDTEDENPNGFKPGTLKEVKSEAEIFELLGFPHVSRYVCHVCQSSWRGVVN